MSRYYQPGPETLVRDKLESLQLRRLAATLKLVWTRNPRQKERLARAGFSPGGVSSLADLEHLPLMDKETFRSAYPLGLSCVAPDEIAEMHMSSGSTGTPVVMPYTGRDLAQWGDCMARCYVMAGGKKGDPVQITPSFGLFNGGFGMYHGARAAGLFIIPTGAGNTRRQIRLAQDFHTRIITGVVSYGIRLLEVLEETGLDLPDLQIGIFGAESFSEAMKTKIGRGLGVDVFDIYGMTETGGVGTLGMDCPDHNGIHVWEDHYLVEIVEPDSTRVLPDGEEGELVVTSLTREALPIVRFRTGDLTRVLSRQRCACGRTGLRLAPITGRVDDMLVVKGINFFPRQVEEILMRIPGLGPNYQIVVEENEGVSQVRINVEGEGVTGATVLKALKEGLGFSPAGDVWPPGSLPRPPGKARRVIHRRRS